MNLSLGSDDLTEINLTETSAEQLKWVSPVEKMLIDQVDVMIAIWGSSNTRNLSNVDPDKQRTRIQARRELTQTYMQRSAEGKLRWVATSYPCPAFAQDAEMSLREYENFVYAATFADQEDRGEMLAGYPRSAAAAGGLAGGEERDRGPRSQCRLEALHRRAHFYQLLRG